MIIYDVIYEVYYSEELGSYRSYGIRALALKNGSWREAAFIHDVSPCYELVSTLAAVCTWHRLEPEQLRYVVEDAI